MHNIERVTGQAGQKFRNLDDYGCPKIQELNFDWLCFN